MDSSYDDDTYDRNQEFDKLSFAVSNLLKISNESFPHQITSVSSHVCEFCSTQDDLVNVQLNANSEPAMG